MEPHTVCKWCYLKTITSPQFLKVFIEFVTILFLSYVLFFWPWDIRHLNSTTREWTCTARLGRQSLKHWTTREIPIRTILGPERILESNKELSLRQFYTIDPLCEPALHLYCGQATVTTSKWSQISTMWVFLSSMNFEYSSDLIWVIPGKPKISKISTAYLDQKVFWIHAYRLSIVTSDIAPFFHSL